MAAGETVLIFRCKKVSTQAAVVEWSGVECCLSRGGGGDTDGDSVRDKRASIGLGKKQCKLVEEEDLRRA